MKKFNLIGTSMLCLAAAATVSCNNENKVMEQGSYGYDVKFLDDHGIKTIELKSEDGQSKVLLIPAFQARVMTSTADGDKGTSYGWINYRFIEAGQKSNQFNPYGGEERFWLGPEGGPFSLYFEPGAEQVYDNWVVPTLIDTEAYDVAAQTPNSVKFTKDGKVSNASGTEFNMGVERTITLFSKDDVAATLDIDIDPSVKCVAYESNNVITNKGDKEWTKETGLPSIWMLSHFNFTPATTVFIPYNTKSDVQPIVNDTYFGKVPAERLIVDTMGTIFFKIDGKLRSKIGVPNGRATNYVGSYDSDKKILSIMWYNMPEGQQDYVNGNWGPQDDPFNGDAINAYNDGPLEDGSIMGPFYEVETSSPGAALKPGESKQHIQRVYHFEGDEAALNAISKAVLNLDLQNVAKVFPKNL